MCVTNITYRRSQPVVLPNNSGASCSGLTARLLGTFEVKVEAKEVQHTQHRNVPSYYQQQQQASAAAPSQGESKPRRRRRPQKPGKTAKMNDRHFVVHKYDDHAQDEPEHDYEDSSTRTAFPFKLHVILDIVERDGYADVVSWQPHGRCFVIHKPKEFVQSIMPKYFGQAKFTSFQRQLNLYGFNRLTRGADAGGYYHELFLRGKPFLVKRMARIKVKGTGFKAASSPDQEPNFYSMPPVLATSEAVSMTITPQGSPQPKRPLLDDSEKSFSINGLAALSCGDPSLGLKNPLGGLQLPFQFYSQDPIVSSCAHPVFPDETSEQPALIDQEADPVLDEAVEMLFNNEDLPDQLDEFIEDWEPDIPDALEDDGDLADMLDLLIEDM